MSNISFEPKISKVMQKSLDVLQLDYLDIDSVNSEINEDDSSIILSIRTGSRIRKFKISIDQIDDNFMKDQ